MKNKQKAIDLGLPSGLKWATCNVGADNPEEYGNYYAWGEIKKKRNYSWSAYKYGKNYNILTKYNTNDACGTVDDFTTLRASDDVATANWSSEWRMPTDADWTELREKCTWTWIDNYNGTGVRGCEVKGPNGNSIFLPTAGCYYNNSLYDASFIGCYWSSSLYSDNPHFAWDVYIHLNRVFRGYDSRYYGRSVRPVCE